MPANINPQNIIQLKQKKKDYNLKQKLKPGRTSDSPSEQRHIHAFCIAHNNLVAYLQKRHSDSNFLTKQPDSYKHSSIYMWDNKNLIFVTTLVQIQLKVFIFASQSWTYIFISNHQRQNKKQRERVLQFDTCSCPAHQPNHQPVTSLPMQRSMRHTQIKVRFKVHIIKKKKTETCFKAVSGKLE